MSVGGKTPAIANVEDETAVAREIASPRPARGRLGRYAVPTYTAVAVLGTILWVGAIIALVRLWS